MFESVFEEPQSVYEVSAKIPSMLFFYSRSHSGLREREESGEGRQRG